MQSDLASKLSPTTNLLTLCSHFISEPYFHPGKRKVLLVSRAGVRVKRGEELPSTSGAPESSQQWRPNLSLSTLPLTGHRSDLRHHVFFLSYRPHSTKATSATSLRHPCSLKLALREVPSPQPADKTVADPSSRRLTSLTEERGLVPASPQTPSPPSWGRTVRTGPGGSFIALTLGCGEGHWNVWVGMPRLSFS